MPSKVCSFISSEYLNLVVYLIHLGQDEGSINMDEGEEFDLIELDQGDGWTRVRRLREVFEEGFVPTTYIECNLYDNNLTNNGHMAIAANNATATTTTTA